MSRKKKRQEQLEAERRANENARRSPEVVYGPMGGIYPVAPSSNIIQLPPIVQPVVMVPFSSQMQPLATYIDDEDDDDYDY